MDIIQAFDEFELGSEQRSDRRRVVPLDWQAAAFLRSIETEGPDDCNPSDFERASEMRNVCIALPSRCEEMQDGAIVPDADGRHLPVPCHVGFNPGDPRRSPGEPRACPCEGD